MPKLNTLYSPASVINNNSKFSNKFAYRLRVQMPCIYRRRLCHCLPSSSSNIANITLTVAIYSIPPIIRSKSTIGIVSFLCSTFELVLKCVKMSVLIVVRYAQASKNQSQLAKIIPCYPKGFSH